MDMRNEIHWTLSQVDEKLMDILGLWRLINICMRDIEILLECSSARLPWFAVWHCAKLSPKS